MKTILSTISKLFFWKKQSNSKTAKSEIVNTSEKTVRLTDEFEMNVKGVPTNLTPTEQRMIFMSLLKNGLKLSEEKKYKKGDTIFHGRVLLNIKDGLYHLEYSINAVKLLHALSVYKEAFDYVNEGAVSGVFDPELAEMASDFLKESAWQEILKVSKQNQMDFSQKKHLDKHLQNNLVIDGQTPNAPDSQRLQRKETQTADGEGNL